jgi:serine/threonine protein phosphatase PrpC
VVKFAGETHPGRVHKHNEDSIGWLIPEQLWLVADGMGGHASGEVASRIVKDTILKSYDAGKDDLRPAIMRAHEAIMEAARRDRQLKGMGSTIVMARIEDDHCRVAWCGDSRAYLWRDGSLRCVSRDHSYLQYLVETTNIPEEVAAQHPRSKVLVRALGTEESAPDETEFRLSANDWIILCSDGLNDELSDSEIAVILAACESPNQATQRLIEATLEHGARDNVSVIAIQCAKIAAGDGDATGMNKTLLRS